MAALDSISDHSGAQPGVSALPASRSAWPASAQQAYRRTLSELNSWCRDLDWPPGNNAWVAETAVREAWVDEAETYEHGDRLAA